MINEGVKRKLTAILSADVKGYSRLMREDEAATVERLKAYREAMSTLIQKHRGRVVDSPGDNLLAEFASIVDAVECAVEIQEELQVSNAELPESRKMEFRIGVNLGDVIEDGERIYGDGVNIAARVEGLAEAGGICISATVYDHIRKKLTLGYEDLGEQAIKNIAEPVRIYRVLTGPETTGKVLGERKVRMRLRRWGVPAAVVAFLIIAGVLAIYNFYFRLPPVATASDVKIPTTLPKGPSIAVLPFVNMSGDPEQGYFSDGLTENIITGISACPKLFVIARNSTFTYKGRPVKIQQVARELGVQYVLEGSVQKAGGRVRITAQLIDATTGHHVWAEKYDRDLKDIFALQDEITIMIMTALEVELTEGEQARLRLRGPGNLEAFMKLLKAIEYFRRHNKEDNVLARQQIKEVIALVPEHSVSHALLAMTHLMDLWCGTEHPLISVALASKSTKKAIALDNNNSDAYISLSNLYTMRKQHENAIAAGKQAVLLNPNGADAYCQLAYALHQSGRPVEAIEFSKKAIRLNPIPPSTYFHTLGHAYWAIEQYEEALEAYEKAVLLEPANVFAHIGLTATYSIMGREEEARAAAIEVLRINSEFSPSDIEKTSPNKDRALIKRYAEALRRAGLK